MMKNPLFSRLLAMVLLAVLLAIYYHRGEVSNHDMGKEAYLAKESESYNARYGSPKITKDLLSAGSLFATLFVMLETTAFLIRKLPMVSVVYRNAHASTEDLSIL